MWHSTFVCSAAHRGIVSLMRANVKPIAAQRLCAPRLVCNSGENVVRIIIKLYTLLPRPAHCICAWPLGSPRRTARRVVPKRTRAPISGGSHRDKVVSVVSFVSAGSGSHKINRRACVCVCVEYMLRVFGEKQTKSTLTSKHTPIRALVIYQSKE